MKFSDMLGLATAEFAGLGVQIDEGHLGESIAYVVEKYLGVNHHDVLNHSERKCTQVFYPFLIDQLDDPASQFLHAVEYTSGRCSQSAGDSVGVAYQMHALWSFTT